LQGAAEYCGGLPHRIIIRIIDVAALQGGPLCNDLYQLAQFHFHWGSINRRGSEHKVDGVTYAGEVRSSFSGVIMNINISHMRFSAGGHFFHGALVSANHCTATSRSWVQFQARANLYEKFYLNGAPSPLSCDE